MKKSVDGVFNGCDERSEDASVCGCFFCLKVFPVRAVTHWIDRDAGTAMCPYCGNDTLLWERPGLPITEEFLKEMKDYWVR